jgi:cytochrome P450
MDPIFAELRETEPVSRIRLPYGGEAWLLTRHDDNRLLLTDRRFSRAAAVGENVPRLTVEPPGGSALAIMDPPEHTRLRKLVGLAFTSRRIELLRPRVQKLADELLTAMQQAGPPVDLVAAFALPLPITVIGELFGVPDSKRYWFSSLASRLLSSTAYTRAEVGEAVEQLSDYLAALIAERRTAPTDDLPTKCPPTPPDAPHAERPPSPDLPPENRCPAALSDDLPAESPPSPTDDLLAECPAASSNDLLGGRRATPPDDLLGEGRAAPPDDLLGALVRARDDDDRLSEHELVTLCGTLLGAGYENTANTIASFTYLLMAEPALFARLHANPDLVPNAVEELLRYAMAGLGVSHPRIATEDVEISGVLIRRGEAVFASLPAANHDPDVFADPDRIDIDRNTTAHLAFGHGVHHCLGAQLARMELQVALTALIQRFPTLRLAAPNDPVDWKLGLTVRGPRSLPVAW